MSNNVTLPGTGVIVETIDQGGGVERQRVSVGDIVAGSNIIGKVGIDQTTPGTTNAVQVTNSSFAVTGTFWQATQPVSGTFWQTTQPVSIATMPSTPVTGTFWQTTQPVSLPLGQTTMAASTPVTLASNQSALAVTVPVGQTTMSASTPVAIASNQSVIPIAGNTASGASDADNPIKIGGLAKTANPTAVTDGQRVAALHDKLGKQVVVGSIRDLKGSQFTTITSSTAETTVVTAVAATFLDIYGVIIENTSAAACKVTFKDSTAGTTRFEIYVPAGDTRGFMLPESGATKQATVNNNWTATCGTSVASIVITIFYIQNL